MKSKTFKKSKKQKLFVKYSKNNEYLIEKEILITEVGTQHQMQKL